MGGAGGVDGQTVAIGLAAGPVIDYASAAAAQLADPQAYFQGFAPQGGD